MQTIHRLLPTIILIIPLALIACQQDGNSVPATTVAGQNTRLPAATPVVDDVVDLIDVEAEVTATSPATEVPETTRPPATPTATVEPQKALIVCMAEEPADLYLYGDDSPAAIAIRHALYESPYTTLDYTYQSLALEKLPSLDENDAFIEVVEAGAGDLVVNAQGQIVNLVSGERIVDAAGETVVFDDEPVEMQQMRVQFSFRPLMWADDTPVTAGDSVFSFQMAADPATPQLDPRTPFTAGYKALDERRVEWTGLPGYLDTAYQTNVWTPLPEHILGDLDVAELATADATAVTPLGYGPFQIDTWTEGEDIRLVVNPNYDRAAEDLPRLTELVFRFVGSSPQGLPDDYAGCDVITQDVLATGSLPALENVAGASWIPNTANSTINEYLMFGINSAGGYDRRRPDWFEDATVRQAIAQCIDRDALVKDHTFDRGEVLSTYVSAGHPLFPTEDVVDWPYDPQDANALLDAAGYLDQDGDGIREDVAATVPFSVTIGVNSESELRMAVSDSIVDNLRSCGIVATTTGLPAGSWFASGPAGPLFGRQFDLALMGWLSRIEPDCTMFMSNTISGPPEQGYAGWRGVNVSGWTFEAYDEMCREALAEFPGQPEYVGSHAGPLATIAEQLPVLPLFSRLRVAAAQESVVNFGLDPTQPSELWNVFEWDKIEEGP